MDLPDFKNLCRLCLNQDRSLTKIFPENENIEPSSASHTGIASKIMACVGIVVEPGENLPDQICNCCLDGLLRWEKFKEICDDANEKLIYYSTGMPPLPDEVLEKNLQKSNSDNLENSSDFGLGDVSLLEHDSLFSNIDGCRDENVADNELIANKSFSSLFKQSGDDWSKSEKHVIKEGKDISDRETKQTQWREKYSRIHMKKFSCELCSKVFSKFSMLLQHDGADHGDIVLTEVCDKCGRLFISKQRLDIHHQMKHRDKVYECGVCGLKSISEKSLKVHKIRHSGRFVCDICGLATGTNSKLQEHRQTHVEKLERLQYNCDSCGQIFTRQQTLQEHLKTHKADKQTWKCGVCGQLFKKKQYLNKHKTTHSIVKSCVCDECGAVLKNKTTLYIHKLTHGEKQHRCNFCDKMFFTKNLLTRHLGVHSLQERVCPICDKTFSRKDTLMLHLNTHQEESQMFHCDRCKKSFSLRRYLKRHIARIHGEDGQCNLVVS